ncbi:cobyric acid synthase [Desertibacillus haloalkaliphilus]|uniref:cobyric acid synthase n=1 Tax=Desertibacillus haloalkaliphilus TaxID=1328930 RepID=UPI001C27F1BE|nr:cobyric acid synthase [Desertibacillus haloalkaliphilus]MBU8907186.1 cobyric acid synthase [Desertibacillus haloalkaliphilus]
MKGIMLQGTASDVGKSVLCTALCRIFQRRNLKVAPFKSQNMSNNSYVTRDGKEIGRAQGVQAEAAKIEASVFMNPILLKPRSDCDSEVIRFGTSFETLSGKNYREQFYQKGIEIIVESLQELESDYDYLVIEGAGSPVEVNLNDREIVNMKVAELADVPVVLVADIDRGGVFASIVGTLALLSEEEKSRVVGIIVNKFRGDLSLFESGIDWIEEYTGKKVIGVVPHLQDMTIEGEDSLSLTTQFQSKKRSGEIDIAVIELPYISNYTDLEPFRFEEDVSIRFVRDQTEFGQPDAVIIPGTKSTFHDLKVIKERQLHRKLKEYAQDSGTIVGLCGGYQMLGDELIDKAGSDTGIVGNKQQGLGIAPLVTYFHNQKKTIRSKGILVDKENKASTVIEGYEIHLGETVRKNNEVSPLLLVNDEAEGVNIDQGRIIGTYFHSLFHNDEWRTDWLNKIREQKGMEKQAVNYLHDEKDASFERLAKQTEKVLDIDYLLEMIDNWGSR